MTILFDLVDIHAFVDGRTEPNFDDVALAFADLNIQLSDIEEYITNVDPLPCVIDVPKFPVPKESHLNFLKPGSKEVVTRMVHIHEHLPPIYPEKEGIIRLFDFYFVLDVHFIYLILHFVDKSMCEQKYY